MFLTAARRDVCSPKPGRKPSLLQLSFGKRKSAKASEPPLSTSPRLDGPSTETLPSVDELEAQLEQLNDRVRIWSTIFASLLGVFSFPTNTESCHSDHRCPACGRTAGRLL